MREKRRSAHASFSVMACKSSSGPFFARGRTAPPPITRPLTYFRQEIVSRCFHVRQCGREGAPSF